MMALVLAMMTSIPGLLVPHFPVDLAHHSLLAGISALQASADPFSDPMFGAATAAASQSAETTGLQFTPVVTGLVCYGVGFLALTYWDEKVLPGLQRKGFLPYSSEYERMMDEKLQRREAEKRARTLTPITAAHRPPVEDLDSKACHYIGTVNGVRQYLCVRKDESIGEECDFSEEFSAMYKQPVVICKKADTGVDVRDFAP